MTFKGWAVYENNFTTGDPPRRQIDLFPLWESGNIEDLEDLPANLRADELWLVLFSPGDPDVFMREAFLSVFTESDGVYRFTNASGAEGVVVCLQKYGKNKEMQECLLTCRNP